MLQLIFNLCLSRLWTIFLAAKSSYHLKYAHLVGDTVTAEKLESSEKSFGLVSAKLKRDRRTIEETQREMREKKMKKK